jgi:TRAP-type mannitol/chloroaromatic compound transport system permease large subunit
MGAVAVLIIATLRGEASFELIWDSLMRTMKSTGTIIWVTIGAAALAGAYTIAGGPRFVADMIVGSEMPTMFVLLSMMFILLIMGAFMDWVGIVLLIIPVFLPIVMRLPIEEIGVFGQLEPRHLATWFGVLSQICGPAAYLADRYLQRLSAVHWHTACCAGGIINVAVDRHGSAVTR